MPTTVVAATAAVEQPLAPIPPNLAPVPLSYGGGGGATPAVAAATASQQQNNCYWLQPQLELPQNFITDSWQQYYQLLMQSQPQVQQPLQSQQQWIHLIPIEQQQMLSQCPQPLPTAGAPMQMLHLQMQPHLQQQQQQLQTQMSFVPYFGSGPFYFS
jgi:hypothetical protein